jgi:dTDP-4-amino-4,6-dideoxygalactose transaminase
MTKKRIFLSPPHMGGDELAYVKAAFESNYIAPLGSMVDRFEQDFAETFGLGHALALSSGTAAMHLALCVLGIGPGDEVFASTLTFIGSVTPVVGQVARPVFIDADRETRNMDPDLLAAELERCAKKGKLPKSVIPTDLYGQCCDYERIFACCSRYQVPVVVDAAEALGASCNGTAAGAGAAAAVFSFNGNKIITTSGGGMLASNNKDFIEKARFLSQQARDPAPHYEHSQIGFNYRMSNIVAAVGCGQLKVLAERVRRKREICNYYQGRLKGVGGIDFMPEAPYGKANRWLTVVLIDPGIFGADRERVRLALEDENIESRPVWKPMHLQPVFAGGARSADDDDLHRLKGQDKGWPGAPIGCRVVGGAVAEELFDKGLCLPSGTAMTTEDLDRVVSIILGCAKP